MGRGRGTRRGIDGVRLTARQATGAVRERFDGAAQSLRHGYRQAQRAARRHPAISAAIVIIGIGFVAGIAASIAFRSRPNPLILWSR
jgi:hypothetical protein